MAIRLLFCLTLFAFSASAAPTNFWCSPTELGSTNNGLAPTTPWSYAYAQTHIGASNTLIFMGGGYNGDFTMGDPWVTLIASNKWGNDNAGLGCWFTNFTDGGGFALYPATAHHVTVDGLIISNALGPGIYITGTNTTIRNCWVSDTGNGGAGTGDGIYGKNLADILIEYCLTEFCGEETSQNHGIYVGGTNVTVRNCVSRYNCAFGIQFNVSSGFCQNCKLYNCLTYRNDVKNGPVYEIAFSSDSGTGGGTNYCYNNTFYSTDNNYVYVSRTTVFFTNNCHNGDPIAGTAGVITNVGADYKVFNLTNFVNPWLGQWTLKANSAARGIANANSIPPIDFYGSNQTSVVDAGAFQYDSWVEQDPRNLATFRGDNFWNKVSITNFPSTSLGRIGRLTR